MSSSQALKAHSQKSPALKMGDFHRKLLEEQLREYINNFRVFLIDTCMWTRTNTHAHTTLYLTFFFKTQAKKNQSLFFCTTTPSHTHTRTRTQGGSAFYVSGKIQCKTPPCACKCVSACFLRLPQCIWLGSDFSNEPETKLEVADRHSRMRTTNKWLTQRTLTRRDFKLKLFRSRN